MPALANQKRERFCLEFLVDLNAARSAIRAGYSARTAGQIGSDLRKKLDVRARIDELIAERALRTSVSADRVIRELARLSFSDIRDVVRWNGDGIQIRPAEDLADDAGAAIAKVTETTTGAGDRAVTKVAIEMHDKSGPLRLLAQHLGVGAGSGAPVEDPEAIIGGDGDPDVEDRGEA